jgi:predicted O-methyltransferase YrrM
VGVLEWIQRRFDAAISRACYDAVRRALIEEMHDIRHEAQRIALRETAEFVLGNVPLERVAYATKDDLLVAAIHAAGREGLFLEFGVFRGDSINRIAELCSDVTIYGFDSFKGIPEAFHFAPAGTFALENLPPVRDNVTLVDGWFEDTLPRFLSEQSASCSFIHIDCDLYSSAHTVLSALAPRIRSGTVILFDEFFNFPNWRKQEYAAFVEFVELNAVRYEYLGTTFRSAEEMRSGCHQVAIRVLEITHASSDASRVQ